MVSVLLTGEFQPSVFKRTPTCHPSLTIVQYTVFGLSPTNTPPLRILPFLQLLSRLLRTLLESFGVLQYIELWFIIETHLNCPSTVSSYLPYYSGGTVCASIIPYRSALLIQAMHPYQMPTLYGVQELIPYIVSPHCERLAD
jgi:hypothetical protein